MKSLQGSISNLLYVLWIDGFNYDKAKYQNKDNKMMAWAMNFFPHIVMLLTNAAVMCCNIGVGLSDQSSDNKAWII